MGYGVSDWFEAGAYLPVYTVTRNGKLLLDGVKLRALFAVPQADSRRFFYGVNFELSRNSRVWDESRYGGEVRPIIGARSGSWDFIANPILDTSFNGLWMRRKLTGDVRDSFLLQDRIDCDRGTELTRDPTSRPGLRPVRVRLRSSHPA